MKRSFTVTVAIGLMGLAAGCQSMGDWTSRVAGAKQQPNIVLILADDLGYSDISPYGGEISTPNLEKLAASGVRLTHFHAAPSCSPTRSMMLSGADTHVAGVGAMAEHTPPQYVGQVGFEGVLTDRVATIAERLAEGGYQTMMAGKWHLGQDDGERPAQRGFQHSYTLLQGASNHFGHGGFTGPEHKLTGATYLEDDKPVDPGEDFYSSDTFTTKIIDAIKQADRDRPFFAYLAFTAPHSPLMAPAEDIERYKGKYDAGWAALAQSRLKAMAAKGVLPGTLNMPSDKFGPSQDSWDALTPRQRAVEARKMEVLAAMVDRIDQNIGRVLTALEETGERDNTIIVVLSDNGPAGETGETFAKILPGFDKTWANRNQDIDAMGSTDSFVFLGPNWAQAAAAPSRQFKAFLTEGGTLIPAIFSYPGLPQGATNEVIGDVRDIAPTLLSLAGVPQNEVVNGKSVAHIEGADLMPWLRANTADRPIEAVALQFYEQSSVRYGPWKLLRIAPPVGTGDWQLFNTLEDPAETKDRMADEPDLTAELKAAWAAYSQRHKLVEPDQQNGAHH